jgi:hypothetical protein
MRETKNKIVILILYLIIFSFLCTKQQQHQSQNNNNSSNNSNGLQNDVPSDNEVNKPMANEQYKTNEQIQYIPIYTPAGQRHTWNNEWNVHIANAIDSFGAILLNCDSLPLTDIEKLCPTYCELSIENKKVFWALFFASIAKFESNFDSTCRFQEPASLNYIYSEGLLQLSYGDEKNYVGCPIDKTKNNILNPKVNLTSGVIILTKQIRNRKTLFTSKHYYWSVLTNKQTEIISFFQNNAGVVNFCNLSTTGE